MGRTRFGIMDCVKYDPDTRIQFAFATTVKEAALLVRLFGNLAENRDTSEGAIWGPRPWLEAIGDEEVRKLLYYLSKIVTFFA